MSLKCVKCGTVIDKEQYPGEDKAGVCRRCLPRDLNSEQERNLEKHGTFGYRAKQHR